ncbi:MAG: sugar phosphate isomerase/epimerase [Acidobacteria bacterium]|nr:sugar phosphate isomerase/epimerase [Acidobacteriota bacterium]MBI3427734.1 sugar phosphate isomerase/epimerase [Acidobacteriota bacterium]
MHTLTRRNFLQTLSASVAAPAVIRANSWAAAKIKKLPLAVSTLGCPKWDWPTILKNTSQWGFAALELRGLLDQLDLPKCPELSGTRLQTSLKDLAALDLKVSDLGSSMNMHEPDAAKRATLMEETKRFIDLAHAMKVPYVRVFPNTLVKGEEKAVTIARIIAGLRELGDHAKGSGVSIIVESHGEFTNAPLLLEIIRGADHPQVAFLWDTHHTFVAGEAPEVTIGQLKDYLRHAHLKDSRPDSTVRNGHRYVLTGTGVVPVKEIVRVLVKNGHRGYYSFEWEKRGYAELEEPEIAFPHYVKVMREYLTEAGVKA